MTTKPKLPSKHSPDTKIDGIVALLSALTKSFVQLSAVVEKGNTATAARFNVLDENLDRQFGAIADDFFEQSETIESLGDSVSALAIAMSASESDMHNGLSNIERRLGGIELGLDAVNRRSENDTRDLLRRVVALEAAGR